MAGIFAFTCSYCGEVHEGSPSFAYRAPDPYLSKRAIASAIESGFINIELWCIKGNRPAETTYEQAGFLLTGKERTSSKLTGNPINERHYSKSL